PTRVCGAAWLPGAISGLRAGPCSPVGLRNAPAGAVRAFFLSSLETLFFLDIQNAPFSAFSAFFTVRFEGSISVGRAACLLYRAFGRVIPRSKPRSLYLRKWPCRRRRRRRCCV